jgi:hypothetical protein
MATCKNCGGPMDWSWDETTKRYVPLEPVGLDGDLDKTFVTPEGELRADHRDRCRGTTITVTRLSRRVPADPVPIEEAPARRGRRRKSA